MPVWKLTYEQTEFPFGDVVVEKVRFEGASFRVDDAPSPRRDGSLFGQDFIEPGDIVISVAVDAGGITDPHARRRFVAEHAEEFSSAWVSARLRLSVAGTAILHAGEHGHFEGRPRGVEWDNSDYASGFLRGTARFVRNTTDVIVVNEDGNAPWHEVSVGLVPSLTGDIIAPLIAPVTTTIETSRAASFEVTGADAWPVYTVTGPLDVGASIECVGVWTARLNRALTFDDIAEFDTRPGRRVMRLNGAPVNLLADGARLSEMRLPPGSRQLALRGRSLTGLARVTARWQTRKDSL